MPPRLCRSWLHLCLFTCASVGVDGRELEKGWPVGEGREDNIIKLHIRGEGGAAGGAKVQVRWGPEWVEGQPSQAWMKL